MLQKSAALFDSRLNVIPGSVTLAEDLLFLKGWCKQIADILQHTAQNVCSFAKKAYPETDCQDE